MALEVVRGNRFGTLVDGLADALRRLQNDPFARVRVLVGSPTTGRVVGQEVARRLGISAGVDYLTPAQLLGRLAEPAGLVRDRSRWLGSPLDLAVWEAVTSMTDEFPVLARAAHPERPGGRRALATRLARLLRWYLDHDPDLLAGWLEGADEGPGGAELPERLAWQPELLRRSVEALEVDPCELLDALLAAARADAVPTLAFGLDELTIPRTRLLAALAESRDVTAFQPPAAGDAEWIRALGAEVHPARDEPAAPPHLTLHGSHGPARQVEVLRDELARAFAEDPTLEPRDVAIVCPRPGRYATLLDSAFAAVPGRAHPGRSLRVAPVGGRESNPVLKCVVQLLRLGESRASATAITELVTSSPIAHRWRLEDRESVTEIVEAAGIHWGMDAGHRASFNLTVTQNTWMRGLDRVLVGLAVSPRHDSGLSLTGTDAVGSSDLPIVGALCELVSRMRRLIAQTAAPVTVPEWVATTRQLLADFVGVPFTDEWLVLQVHAALARLAADHAGSPTELTRHEFAHLLEATERSTRRVSAGNGSLHVIDLGELAHVSFRLVAMIGITDDVVPGRDAAQPDTLEVATVDRRAVRFRQLRAHALAAERLIVVRQTRSERTGDEVADGAAVDWLVDALGSPVTRIEHPATATSEANFHTRPSFDEAARAGALARRGATTLPPAHARRRHDARSLPVGDPPAQVDLGQLERFLIDPAKAFLRSAAGISAFPGAVLSDELPLALDGLEQWKISDELLNARIEGRDPADVAARLRETESLPPGELAARAFRKADAKATELWGEAAPLFERPATDHRIDLTVPVPGIGEVRVIDTVRCHGGEPVSATLSKGAEKFVRPWLESLALSASGDPTPASLVRYEAGADPFLQLPTTRRVGVPDAAVATDRLTAVLLAFALGQHRLIPVPADAALAYASQHARGTLSPRDWRGAPGWRHPKWSKPGDAWPLFFSDVGELFDDAPLPEDPALGLTSAFQNWALALYSGFGGL